MCGSKDVKVRRSKQIKGFLCSHPLCDQTGVRTEKGRNGAVLRDGRREDAEMDHKD